MSKSLYSAAVSKDMDDKLFKIGAILGKSEAITLKDGKPTRYSITRFALDLLVRSYDMMNTNSGQKKIDDDGGEEDG